MKHLLRYKLFESVDKKWEEINKSSDWNNLFKRRINIYKLYPNLIDEIEEIFDNGYSVFKAGEFSIQIEDNWNPIHQKAIDMDAYNTKQHGGKDFESICIRAIDDDWFIINVQIPVTRHGFKYKIPQVKFFKCDQLDGLFDFLNKVKNKQPIL
jgi:hypothetical protein